MLPKRSNLPYFHYVSTLYRCALALILICIQPELDVKSILLSVYKDTVFGEFGFRCTSCIVSSAFRTASCSASLFEHLSSNLYCSCCDIWPLRLGRPYPRGNPGTHFIGGWENPRTSLDTKAWRKISIPLRHPGSNLSHQPVAKHLAGWATWPRSPTLGEVK